MSEVATKNCSVCAQAKPATKEFWYGQKHGKYGLMSICKVCDSKRGKTFRASNPNYAKDWINENRPRTVGYFKKYRSKPEAKERIKAYAKSRADITSKRAAERYAANPAKWLEQGKVWRKTFPEKVKAKHARQRATRRAAPGSHTHLDVINIYNSQDGKCHWCSKELNGVYHVDHVVPLSRGGSNWPDNIVCACPPCNLRKGTKMPNEFKQKQAA